MLPTAWSRLHRWLLKVPTLKPCYSDYHMDQSVTASILGESVDAPPADGREPS